MGRERIELEWQEGHAIKEFSDFLRSEPLRPEQFAKAKKLGLRILREVATIVTPGALLA